MQPDVNRHDVHRGAAIRRLMPAAVRPLLVVLLLVFAATACSRLTFVRPDAGRGSYEQVAPEYSVSDGKRSGVSARASLRLLDAQRALQEGDIDTAAEAVRAALKTDPESVDAHTLMAVVLEQQKRDDRAGRHYREAAELRPAGAQFNNYGGWLCRNGRESESLQWFERALADRTYATPSYALANAGACADRAGQGDKASVWLQAALKIDPESPVALGAMAEREFRAGRAFRARAFSERRLAAAPADARALVLASQIEFELGDKKAGNHYVQRLGAEFPGATGSDAGGSGKR